jgi:hypothetical protein
MDFMLVFDLVEAVEYTGEDLDAVTQRWANAD